MIEHPKSETGQVEALKGDLVGFWSRRLDKYNRLVYRIDDNVETVTVVSLLGHYEKGVFDE